MPLPSVHFRLALLALEAWRAEPAHAPFDPLAAGALNAYWHGSLGPDTGHFPGGVPIFAQLAHRSRTGELTCALIRSARTEAERAFGWGWLTHVLADAALHPVINRCALRLLAGGNVPADLAALSVAHSRVELGLDVHVAVRDPEVARMRLRHAFDGRSIEYVARAYEGTYLRPFDRAALLRSHRAVTRMANALARLEQLHGLAAPGAAGPRRRVLQGLGGVLAWRLDPLARAFLEPVAPPRPLLAALVQTRETFRELVLRHQAEGLARLGNPDLEGLPPALASAA